MKQPLVIYEKRKIKIERLLERQTKAINQISNLRLAVFVVGAASIILLYIFRHHYIAIIAFVIAVCFFLSLVIRHQKLIDKKDITSGVNKINEDSIRRLNGEWTSFEDTGEEFKDENHSYSADLDIFGKGSVFQWINCANTFIGRQIFAKCLSIPISDKVEIIDRQTSIDELAGKLGWRQNFAAEGILKEEMMHDPEKLIDWGNANTKFFSRPFLAILLRVLPIFTVLILLAYFILPGIPAYLPAIPIVIQFVLIMVNYRKRALEFSNSKIYNKNIRVYYRKLKLFENEKFNTPLLKSFQLSLKSSNGTPAFYQLDKLLKIVDSISNRSNLFYFIINLLTLWDYQIMIALEMWKKKSGGKLGLWLNTIGDVEVLSNLSIIRYEHSDWAFPSISEENQVYQASNMGHPLLPESRVNNDLVMGSPETVLLITGSNMSGKSTLLRTTGINLVLAYAGAPVCASSLICSIMGIYTCMRVSDNLEKNISSFYAELLRIKMIVQAAEEGNKVFFLLDEIFKGTNSRDRHTGAKVLISKLSKECVLGLVSTHDIELAEIENESNSKIKNYHFEENYKDSKIYFDYKLRKGVSTTRNATYLMKLAGINIDQEG